jgi:hypothetical protein
MSRGAEHTEALTGCQAMVFSFHHYQADHHQQGHSFQDGRQDHFQDHQDHHQQKDRQDLYRQLGCLGGI